MKTITKTNVVLSIAAVFLTVAFVLHWQVSMWMSRDLQPCNS
jgi:hypothetical protein